MQTAYHCLSCGDSIPRDTLRKHLEWHQVTTEDLEQLVAGIRQQAVSDVETAATRAREALEQLDDAVSSARASGASWTDIGKAAGIARQSARERWSR